MIKEKTQYVRYTNAAIGLIILNMIAALMHFFYEFHLIKYNGVLRDFILVSNLLCAFVFLMPAIGILFGNEQVKTHLKTYELVWWIYDLIIVAAIWTSVTTLGMVEKFFHFSLPFADSVLLVLTATIGVALAAIDFRSRQWSTEQRQGKNLPISVILLIALNVVLGAAHISYEFVIFSYEFIYRDFIAICNLFITFVFIYSAIFLFFGSLQHKKLILKYQLFWWQVNFFTLVVFGDTVTVFSAFGISGTALQIILSVLGIILSIAGIRAR